MKKLQLLLVALALVSFTFYSCGPAQEKPAETVEEVVEEVAVEEEAVMEEEVAEEAVVEETEEAPVE
ncbi:MAG: hypothetical protein PF485_04625 [Bacteroidales bacterium]|jgi:hypothetical protein|nr:hypothetical protein [Bacteroidales bacterium]